MTIADEVRTEKATNAIDDRRMDAEDKITALLPPLTHGGSQALAKLILARDISGWRPVDAFEEAALRGVAEFVAKQKA